MVKYERIDVEPDIEWLKKKFSLKHAWIIWIPEKRVDIPKGWKRFLMQTHYVYANVTRLEPNYWNKWNERAKRARKKFLSQTEVVIKQVKRDVFIEAFKKTPVGHMFKRDYISYYTQLTEVNEKSVRSYVAYYNKIPIAGLAVHDYHKSSVHMVAFTHKKHYKLQAGTGIIDRWFADSLAL